MLYIETSENIRMLVETTGGLLREQIVRFFSDAAEEDAVNSCIDRFIQERKFSWDARSKIVGVRGSRLSYHDEFRDCYLRAFWIIAAFGSGEIRELWPMRYPCQFGFISSDNQAYDITFCPSLTIASAAVVRREQEMALFLGEGSKPAPDMINHIALVPDWRTGETIPWERLPGGFDSYCVLNRENCPVYTALPRSGGGKIFLP